MKNSNSSLAAASTARPLQQPSAGQVASGTSLAAYARILLVGTFFGIVLAKSELVRWQRIHDMFLFKEPYMYLIMATGIVVGAVSMWAIRRFSVRTVDGKPIVYKPKPFQYGVILGGVVFGAGWAVTGACPGPIFAQIGGGQMMAWLTFLGAMSGMFLYAAFKDRLPH